MVKALITLGLAACLVLSSCSLQKGLSLGSNKDSDLKNGQELPSKDYSKIDIPQEKILWADQYIISKVGEDYFRKNYVFEKDKSSESSSVKTPGSNKIYGWYALMYEYLPLSKVLEKPAFVRIGIHTDTTSQAAFQATMYDPARGELNTPWVVCMNGSAPCTFKISKKDAISKIRNLGITALKQKDLNKEVGIGLPPKQTYDGLYWTLSYSISVGGDCFESHSIQISTETGELKQKGGFKMCS